MLIKFRTDKGIADLGKNSFSRLVQGGNELEIVNRGNLFKSFAVKGGKEERKGGCKFMVKIFCYSDNFIVDCFLYGNYRAYLNEHCWNPCIGDAGKRGLTAEGGWLDGIQSTSRGLAFDRVQEYFF